jgi:peptide/nickel transport system substrate-binding protein
LVNDPTKTKESPMRAGRNGRNLGGAVLVAVLVLVAAMSARSVAASSASHGAVTTLRVGLAAKASTLDPTNFNTNITVTSLGLEPLMILTPAGKLKGWLVQSWQQTGPTTYVYRLRHGIKFWDGNELTAADAAYSLNYNRRAGALTSDLFPDVKSVVARDRYTVVVTLTHRDAAWPYFLVQYGDEIFEKAFALAHKHTLGDPGTLMMGTGPWKFDSLDPTSGAELSANPDWWGGKVPYAHISIKFFADANSEALAFRAGAVDVVPDVGNGKSFAATAAAKPIGVSSCQTAVFAMNTRAAPWSDIHVRRAVAYALNRQQLINVNGGYATPLTSLIPAEQLRTVASQAAVQKLLGSLQTYPYDLAKAKRELAQSAYPHGFKTSLITFDYATFVDESQAIAGMLRKIGIQATVKDVDSGQWSTNITTPSQRNATYTTSGCQSPDPSFYTYLIDNVDMQKGGYDGANYNPPAVQKLIDAGVSTSNPAKRFATYSALLRQVAADEPYVPLFQEDVIVALKPNLLYPTYNATFNCRVWALEVKQKS